eukprot:CAMPEP_0180494252 /NCGR_PEP_ID=MMETSP1036_2-20121128/41138_1 /TAXON_ID=632150 /ORGANISM="Azadinium spinosum, Strain 3D9" /LENGTH=122 /DNA_ID=CAMNT_0022502677 /DNA_START=1 /DNA_END=370 /DNA_ORIENTATION=+
MNGKDPTTGSAGKVRPCRKLPHFDPWLSSEVSKLQIPSSWPSWVLDGSSSTIGKWFEAGKVTERVNPLRNASHFVDCLHGLQARLAPQDMKRTLALEDSPDVACRSCKILERDYHLCVRPLS